MFAAENGLKTKGLVEAHIYFKIDPLTPIVYKILAFERSEHPTLTQNSVDSNGKGVGPRLSIISERSAPTSDGEMTDDLPGIEIHTYDMSWQANAKQS